MSPLAGESNLFRQDDIYRVLCLFLSHASCLSQQVFPLLSNQLAVLGISQPRLAAAKKHNAHSAQDDQAGEQGQHAKADKLTMGDDDALGVDRLLQGDLQQVPLRLSEELVEGVSGDRIVLRSQRQDSDLWTLLQGTRGTREPFLANAPESSTRLSDTRSPVATRSSNAGREAGGVVTRETTETVRTDAREGQAVTRTVPAVKAGVRLTAVNGDLTKVSRKSRRT